MVTLTYSHKYGIDVTVHNSEEDAWKFAAGMICGYLGEIEDDGEDESHESLSKIVAAIDAKEYLNAVAMYARAHPRNESFEVVPVSEAKLLPAEPMVPKWVRELLEEG